MSDMLDFILRKLKLRKNRHSKDALTNVFRVKYDQFKALLDSNSELSKIIAELEDKLQGHAVFGMPYIRSQAARAVFHALRMVGSFDALSNQRYPALVEVFEKLNAEIRAELDLKVEESGVSDWVLPYSRVTIDLIDSVGGKNANLGEIHNRLLLPVPEGFAITTRAYQFFLSENDLVDQIAMKKMGLDPTDQESVNSVSEEVQRLIISATIPEPLQEAILSAYDRIAVQIPRDGSSPAPARISMRSSAIGEDSELSFAGQYLSVLNVDREQILKTYRFIVASLFTPRAISYRLLKGVPDEKAAMSVACILMVDSIASGVMYSKHPFEPDDRSILISAVWGLGPYAVDGTITPDNYQVSRGGEIVERKVALKAIRLTCNPDGGLREQAVSKSDQGAACLTDEQIKTLAGYALLLESHYGVPQDIEWALDLHRKLFILQSRPLGSARHTEKAHLRLPKIDQLPLLASGAVACPGIGCGKAFRVNSEEDLLNFPDGAVMVAVQPSPKFMVIMPKARAIVTDFGSVTGHMASLAREFSVPTLLDTKKATSLIRDGAEITVDAFSGKVYEGIVSELLGFQENRKPCMKETPIYETLKRTATLITPLRLLDPRSSGFTPQNCKSLHDLMRFMHELSYKEMFRIGDSVSSEEGFAIKLVAPIPFDLHLIDLGGGISGGEPHHRKIKFDRIASVPFKALLTGLLNKDLLTHRPRPIEFKGFLSVVGEQLINPHPERFGERSFAIISDKYLNFSSRVGYHYAVLDTYCGANVSNNYVTFSFQGGAADDIRRNRRARAIAIILESIGLSVEVMADRVNAKIQKMETSVLVKKLDTIGRLFQFTRQLDMLMTGEAMVETIAKAFLEEKYHL